MSPRLAHAEILKDGRVLAVARTGKGIVTFDGEEIVPLVYSAVSQQGEVYQARRDDQPCELFAHDGRRIDSLQVADSNAAAEGLIAIQPEREGPWGYADMQGELVVAPRFSRAFPFGQGRAITCDDKGLAIIDPEGREVARPALEGPPRDASAFGNSGLAWVQRYDIALVALDGCGLHLLFGDVGVVVTKTDVVAAFEGRAAAVTVLGLLHHLEVVRGSWMPIGARRSEEDFVAVSHQRERRAPRVGRKR